ncbi:hypothetical protein NC652_041448 [Populus alba x Populus x berolinensis]|nr:hypothetical protein NC652_041448 [Populus alba x Populus x berolinensis]
MGFLGFVWRARRILGLKKSGQNMSLACLACHSVESPSRSFRSYSVSSSDNEGRCTAIANCITRKLSHPPPRANSSFASSSSKVTPQPLNPSNDSMTGPPRLVRSRAVRRDLGAPSSLLHCTDLEKPELAAWVNALPLAGHHHVLPLVVDPSPGWLSPWELHVDFLTSAFYLKDSSFPSVILSSRSHRANQLSLRYTVPETTPWVPSPHACVFPLIWSPLIARSCYLFSLVLSLHSTDSPHPVLLLQGNQFIDYHVLSVVSSSVSFCDLVVAAVIGGVPRATKKC